MESDRELLELAAKAYFAKEVADGVCSFWWDEKEDAIVYIHGDNQDHNGNDVELLWIPNIEDGDALRLAVKLKLPMEYPSDKPYGPDRVAICNGYGVVENIGPDENAAARRAIVRAAAAIGKDIP